MLIACYRLGLLVAAFFALYFTTAKREDRQVDHLDGAALLSLLKTDLPTAASVGAPEGDDRLRPVLRPDGETVGWLAQSYPESLPVIGYAGPTNLLVVFDTSRRVRGVHLLESADTAGHVAKVAGDPRFLSQWNGRHQASLASPGEPVMVSSASLTSEAIARGLAARFGAREMDQWFPGEVPIGEIRRWFPEASRIEGATVSNARGERLGELLRSSRMGVSVRGFQGSQDLLLALDGDRILGVSLQGSRDNQPYTSDVRDGLVFDTPFSSRSNEQILAAVPGELVMVSGASRTAESVEETVREMLRRHFAPEIKAGPAIGWREGIAFAWIGVGLLLGLGPWRGRKRLRMLFSLVSVACGGLWLGLMTGQDQWIKSGMRGSITGSALPLLALTVSALLIPAVFGKNIYCSHLCPHGAAQQLMGSFRKKRHSLPPKLHRFLVGMPWLTLVLLWAMAFLGIGVPFSHSEPFEVWSAGFVALLPVVIFIGGLAAASFLPQAYCHYGCPTGAVLKFLASAPGRWTRRDSIAGGLVALSWFLVPMA
ncbi:4Fe-4S binding protein [Luteolibacter sp. GHJ8]|uniref:4Fe-4S binding protein n=1 Tax=Luteolibacter rhizosphaerae TaxID=2989719 RepID=A0ABT3G5Y0_9BACT|nr:4Fe-4S binding protein [Luteolibacter rhizosphaerae]MCW1914645.1 4Fe-4S binding protein [Luteolibacter rhizosphaerae]